MVAGFQYEILALYVFATATTELSVSQYVKVIVGIDNVWVTLVATAVAIFEVNVNFGVY